MEFVKVFDLAEAGYRTWKFPSLGLIFVGIGAVFFVAPVVMRRLGFSYIGFEKMSYKVFNWIFCGFALVWTAMAFYSTFSEYSEFKNVLVTCSYKTVEGRVEDFNPMPHSGHKDESFTVNGVKFAFSDYVITNAFNNTKSHGGPITEGSYVRICYAPRIGNNHILRLEIQGYKGPIKDYSSGFSPFSSPKDDDEGAYPPMSADRIYITLPWYSSLFMYILLLDFAGILLFHTTYLKTSILLRKSEINAPLPRHLEKDVKQKLANVVLRWDTNEGVIWMRPRALNLIHIPFMITKWSLNTQQTEIIKEDVRVSSGLPLALVMMFFSVKPLFSNISSKNRLPFDPDLILIGFFLVAILVNGWIHTRRMKDLCNRTISSAFK